MRLLLLLTATIVMSFSYSFSQTEEAFQEPTYYSRQMVNISLADISRNDLHGLAYEILDYDFNAQGSEILTELPVQNYLHLRRYDNDQEIYIPENNVTILVYSEQKFLENLKNLDHTITPTNNEGSHE